MAAQLKPTLVDIAHLRVRRSAGFELEIDRLEVQAGSIICIAGPNGSGKSTLVSVLAGLLAPDWGSILIAGQPVGRDLRRSKALLGYVPDDEEWFVGELTAREYLKLLAEVYAEAGGLTPQVSMARAAKMAGRLAFTAYDQQISSLSHGNKKKVQIMAGLMHDPRILVLDELRNGLDPLAIIEAEKLVKEAAKAGTAVVAATHDLWWAERVAEEVVLLNRGRVAVRNATKAILKQHGSVENLFLSVVKGSAGAVHASV